MPAIEPALLEQLRALESRAILAAEAVRKRQHAAAAAASDEASERSVCFLCPLPRTVLVEGHHRIQLWVVVSDPREIGIHNLC